MTPPEGTPPRLPEPLAAALGDRYRLERELGQGGMATVYLAQDLRHHRPVAIKVLHAELSAILGPERFLKEIELTAGLQHPHILPLFDSGQAPGGLLYYVVPFVEAGSLRDRLTREHQLPVADAVRIASDVAAALEYAHGRGVIHRDIKPENILLHDGRPVVADFGIALAVQQAGGQRMTQTGLSLGTPQYMAPEQAMGERAVDARADVYALGCVLYEMLAGEPPFTGPTSQAIMAKVLSDDPRPLVELRKSVPVHVDDAVRTALEKLAADRFPSAAAFAAALADQASGARRAVGSGRAASSPVRTWALLGALVLATGFGAWGWLHDRGTPPREPSVLDVTMPEGSEVITFILGRTLAISPDGRTLALQVNRPGGPQVITRSLDARAATVVRPGLNPNYLFFDATGAALLLLSNDGQSRVSLDGNQVTPFAIPGAFNLISQADGTILTTTLGGDLIRKPAGRDSVEILFAHDSATGNGYWLQDQLPDGRLLVQVGVRNQVMAPIDLLDPRSGRRTRVLDAALEARFAQGYLVYVLATGQLLARPFDPNRPDPTARPVALADSVATVANIAHFAVAKNGTVAYLPVSGAELVRVDRAGTARALLPALRSYHAPRVSPDGRRLLVDFISEGRRDVWVHDPAQNTLTRATFTSDGHDGRWTLDGRGIVFGHTDDAGGVSAYLATPGDNAIRHLYGGPGTDYVGEWLGSMDQAVVVGGLDLIRVRIAEHKTEPLVATRFGEGWPAPSPDGKWLAWASDESGRHEVYLRAVDGGERIQVSTDGGREPVWARNGLLYYRGAAGDHTMMIEAAIATAPSLRVTRRTPLFDDRHYASADPHAGYDVWPDGSAFAMVRPTGVSRVTVIQNFPELARRKAGVAP